jgi:alpha-glucosidase
MLTRWIELGAFNPIYRDHTAIGTSDQEPWVHGPQHEAIRRRYIETRYRLMPYLYTTVEQSTHTGVPVMRPLFIEYAQKDLKGFEPEAFDSQFLFGRALMVAPQRFENLDKYEVRFPTGNWYDFWTGQPVNTSAPVVIEAQLEVLPVFARGGSIIPMQPLAQSTDERPKGALKLLVFPGPNCEGSLYQDDGRTLEYKQGLFLRQSYACTVQQHGVQVNIKAPEGRYQPWWNQIEVIVHGATQPAKSVLVNDRPASASYDNDRGAIHLLFPNVPQEAIIKIAY